MSNTELKSTTVEWKNIPWHKVERVVFKLQKRIFQASQRGDIRAVRRLQKTLINSWSAKVLAVRRVTQDNQGKKTAGVDGVKSFTPKQRLELENPKHYPYVYNALCRWQQRAPRYVLPDESACTRVHMYALLRCYLPPGLSPL